MTAKSVRRVAAALVLLLPVLAACAVASRRPKPAQPPSISPVKSKRTSSATAGRALSIKRYQQASGALDLVFQPQT